MAIKQGRGGAAGAVFSVFTRVGNIVATLGDYAANLISMSAIAPDSGTVQMRMDVEGSVGLSNGGEVTDNADGTVAVAAASMCLRATDSDSAEMWITSTIAVASLALTDNTMHWIYAEYNGGAPQIVAVTSERTDINTNAIIATVYREGTTAHITDRRVPVGGTSQKASARWLETRGATHASGSAISETGTRNFALTAGNFWLGLQEVNTGPFDSSGADRFSAFYRDGIGGWTEQTAQAALSNTQYDDGSGVLASLSGTRKAVHWLYCTVEGETWVIYGRGNYTTNQAANATPPADNPPAFAEQHAFLVGKVTVERNAAVFLAIESAFVQVFAPGAVTSHSDLSNLTVDGDHTNLSLADGSRGVAAEAVWQLLQTAVPARVMTFVLTALTASRSITMPDHDVTLNTVRETSGPTVLTIGDILVGEFVTRVGSTLVGGTPAGGGGATIDNIAVAGPTTISSARRVIVLCNSSAALIGLDLQGSPTIGDEVSVRDDGNEAHMNRITVTRAGSQLINGETTIVLDLAGGQIDLTYTDTDVWKAVYVNAWDQARVIEIDETFIASVSANAADGSHFGTDSSGGNVQSAASVAGHPGNIRLATDSGATSRAHLFMYGGPNDAGFFLNDGTTIVDVYARIPDLSTVAQEYILLFGFGGTINDNAPDPGVFWYYNRLGTGVNWRCRAHDGAETNTDSSTAVTASATVYTRFRIAVNEDGSEVKFSVDEVTVATITTNIPASCRTLIVSLFKTAGTTDRHAFIDRIHYRHQLS